MNEYKEDKDKCVCVNIFAKCNKKDSDGNEMWEKKDFKKDECCVCVNIFTKCEKEAWKKENCCKEKDCCVEVNIFAECDEKKRCNDCD